MYNMYYPYQYNRFEKPLPTPAPIVSKPPNIPPNFPPMPAMLAHPKPPPPKPPKKKFDFKSFKKDTCTSLNDVECFLNNFTHTWKYIRLINLLK